MTATITLTGRLTADPELRFTQSGKAVARFTVVTSRRRKVGDQWEDADTTFWPVNAWEQLAEQVAEQLHKGQAVVVSGHALQRDWTTKEGDKRSRIEVRADAVGPDLRWAKPAVNTSKPAASSGSFDDEPPF